MTAHPLPYPDYLDAIARETGTFATAVAGADPATPVPACPGWSLSQLTVHTGSVHRWFASLLAKDVQAPPSSREVDLELPIPDGGHANWLLTGQDKAHAVLAEVDPLHPMWTWGADPHARFWARRMLFETLVHRTDAEAALSLPSDVDTRLAADGIDEFLVNLPHAASFAPEVVNLRGTGEIISFHSTDTDEHWHVQLRQDTFGLVPAGLADTTVTAPAADLLLFLYGRRDTTTVEGSRDLLTLWTANSAF